MWRFHSGWRSPEGVSLVETVGRSVAWQQTNVNTNHSNKRGAVDPSGGARYGSDAAGRNRDEMGLPVGCRVPGSWWRRVVSTGPGQGQPAQAGDQLAWDWM